MQPTPKRKSRRHHAELEQKQKEIDAQNEIIHKGYLELDLATAPRRRLHSITQPLLPPSQPLPQPQLPLDILSFFSELDNDDNNNNNINNNNDSSSIYIGNDSIPSDFDLSWLAQLPSLFLRDEEPSSYSSPPPPPSLTPPTLPIGHEILRGIIVPLETKERLLDESDKTTKRCIICSEREVSTAFLECQHHLACVKCSRSIILHETAAPFAKCPICRARISRVMKLFDV